MNHRIAVENEQTEVRMSRGYKGAIRKAALATLAAEGFPYRASLAVSLVEKEEIRRLNREFRDVDRPTDVLSFPLLEDPFHPEKSDVFRGCVTLGDVIVCPGVIVSQAKEAGVSFREELSRMVIHSVLHLLGRDHAEPEEEKAMFSLQEAILRDVMQPERT